MKFITLMALYSLLNVLYWLLLFNGSAGGIRIHTVRILSSSSPAYWTTAPYFQDQQFSFSISQAYLYKWCSYGRYP